ncbi:MAG: TrmH family RNA methyltransferase, partial [Chitinophagaceae bacterium]
MSKQDALIIGRQPIIEALQNGRAIDKILFQKNANGDAIVQIRALAKELDVPTQMVPIEKLNYMTRANHQGVIALAALVTYQDLDEVLLKIEQKNELPLLVMLDGVTDVRNIGAIARSAYCCGAQAIIIPDKGVGALNEEAMKSSAGALERIAVVRVNSLLKAV